MVNWDIKFEDYNFSHSKDINEDPKHKNRGKGGHSVIGSGTI